MPLAEVEPRETLTPGTYEVTVTDIQPDVITPRMGRDAGKEVPVFRWTLSTEDGYPLDYLTRRDPTSEKSNLFKAFVAIGIPRADMFTVERDGVVGRMCFATVSTNADGYDSVDSLTPLPVRRAGVTKAEVAAAPAAEPKAATDDELPF